MSQSFAVDVEQIGNDPGDAQKAQDAVSVKLDPGSQQLDGIINSYSDEKKEVILKYASGADNISSADLAGIPAEHLQALQKIRNGDLLAKEHAGDLLAAYQDKMAAQAEGQQTAAPSAALDDAQPRHYADRAGITGVNTENASSYIKRNQGVSGREPSARSVHADVVGTGYDARAGGPRSATPGSYEDRLNRMYRETVTGNNSSSAIGALQEQSLRHREDRHRRAEERHDLAMEVGEIRALHLQVLLGRKLLQNERYSARTEIMQGRGSERNYRIAIGNAKRFLGLRRRDAVGLDGMAKSVGGKLLSQIDANDIRSLFQAGTEQYHRMTAGRSKEKDVQRDTRALFVQPIVNSLEGGKGDFGNLEVREIDHDLLSLAITDTATGETKIGFVELNGRDRAEIPEEVKGRDFDEAKEAHEKTSATPMSFADTGYYLAVLSNHLKTEASNPASTSRIAFDPEG